MNFCDCELRNRAWDPNTHKCRTCGCWYVDTYRENREDVVRLYGKKPEATKKPTPVVLWVLEHRFHRDALTVYGVYSTFEKALDTAKRNLDAMVADHESWFVISEETLDKDPFDFTDLTYDRKRNICVDREGNVSARHQAGPRLNQPDFILTPEERDFHINDSIPDAWRAEWLR